MLCTGSFLIIWKHPHTDTATPRKLLYTYCSLRSSIIPTHWHRHCRLYCSAYTSLHSPVRCPTDTANSDIACPLNLMPTQYWHCHTCTLSRRQCQYLKSYCCIHIVSCIVHHTNTLTPPLLTLMFCITYSLLQGTFRPTLPKDTYWFQYSPSYRHTDTATAGFNVLH